MAMEINSAYNHVYESAFAAQKQETAKKQAASGKETSETASTQKNSTVEHDKAKNAAAYAKELAKIVPSVDFKVGNSYSTAKGGSRMRRNRYAGVRFLGSFWSRRTSQPCRSSWGVCFFQRRKGRR